MNRRSIVMKLAWPQLFIVASRPAAERAGGHRTIRHGYGVKKEPAGPDDISPNGCVSPAAERLRLMPTDLRQPPGQGETLPPTLFFADSPKIKVTILSKGRARWGRQ